MVRVWFNHWFSTVYQIIQLMRKNQDDLYLIGSNEREQAVYQLLCNEWYQEPALHGPEYAEFCLDFCKQHHVDVFIPRRGMLEISRRKADFEAFGVRVMVDDYDKIAPLNQKQDAYALMREWGAAPVPDFEIVTTAQGFAAAYQKLADQYDQVAFKFVHDEGGKSFRLIDNTRSGYASLFHKQTTRMTYSDALAALSERESFPKLMVMPYLPGAEISVDSLKTEDGIILLPRVKDATRVERMEYRSDILEMCRAFYEKCPLEMPCNIQFKYRKDVPYFLEVNTRMSGGIQMACAATGVNIPNIALNKLLGIRKKWVNRPVTTYVTHVETPVVFSAI